MITIWYRLRGLLRVVERDRSVRSLTPPVARSLLAKRRTEVGADTQIGELAAASGFAAWCVQQGWLRRDPFVDLDAEGERSTGKPRLRIDEARKFLDAALDENSTAGLAAAIALLMGMRLGDHQPRGARCRR